MVDLKQVEFLSGVSYQEELDCVVVGRNELLLSESCGVSNGTWLSVEPDCVAVCISLASVSMC